MKNQFIIGLVDRLGTKKLLINNNNRAKKEIKRFALLCEKWAEEGCSSYPDEANLFSDSLIVKWYNPSTPLIALLELSTLFIFAHFENMENPTNPLWIRGAIIPGTEKEILFGKSNKSKKILKNFAITGLELSLAEKIMPGNRLYIDSCLINNRPEMERIATEEQSLLPWPKPNKKYLDIFWCNALLGMSIFEILPKWVNICEELYNKSSNSKAFLQAINTLEMLTYAAFQYGYFRKNDRFYYAYSWLLRYIVWAAKCADVASGSGCAKKFIEICKSLPNKFTSQVSDLFEVDSRVTLTSDMVWKCPERELFKIELIWELAVKAIEV